MGKTSIEWTDASWNPIVGCTEVSPGCANCYAARLAATRLRNTPAYTELATIQNSPAIARPRWTGEIRFLQDRLEEPRHWKAPRKIFVCDMGDLFHEGVSDGQIQQIWNVMARCDLHTFQILTKRAGRMLKWISERYRYEVGHPWWRPLPNVWLGVSAENQTLANERIPLLLATPAAIRWISCEPMLSPINLERIENPTPAEDRRKIDWVVAGGESGPLARPMHPDWVRSLRDQCQAAGVPFFFKQWGEWIHITEAHAILARVGKENKTYKANRETPNGSLYLRIGKKDAGRLLDGREWREFPR